MRIKNAPHPRDFIRTEIINPAGLSVTTVAAALHVCRPALSRLLDGKVDLSGNMALRMVSSKIAKTRSTRRRPSKRGTARPRTLAKIVSKVAGIPDLYNYSVTHLTLYRKPY